MPVHRRDDLAVHLADERHADDVDGLGVGHAQAVDELGLLAEPAHQVADLGSPAVHHHGVHAHEPHEHDVLGEELREVGVLHGVPAVLDDHGLAGELPDVRERLGEDGRLRARVADARIGLSAHDVRRFSSM